MIDATLQTFYFIANKACFVVILHVGKNIFLKRDETDSIQIIEIFKETFKKYNVP